MVGQQIDRYRILKRIGEGGMGAVYLGLDLVLEREVALKVMRPHLTGQQAIEDRFRAEAVALAKLNHSNIATLFGLHQEEAEWVMIMEFVKGRTLEEIAAQDGAMPVEKALVLFRQVLDGIGHAHRMNIVHRDIKPSNVMVTEEGHVKVMDFGIARMLGADRMTRTGHLVGTVKYMAPEQIRGEGGDVRSDVYSLGIVLYEMLTGQVPFDNRSDFDVMRAQVEEAPPRPSTLAAQVPASVEKAILRALEKNPKKRFQTIDAFREALYARAWQHESTLVNSLAFSVAPPASRQRRAWSLYAGGTGVLALVLALILLFRAPGASSAPPLMETQPVTYEHPLPEEDVHVVPFASTPPDSTAGTPYPEHEAEADTLTRWLTRARQYLAERKLTTPADGNARAYADSVLAVDPENEEALALLERIARTYEAWGDAQVKRGDFQRARTYYQASLSIIEENDVVAAKLQKAQEVQGAVHSRIAPKSLLQPRQTAPRKVVLLLQGIPVKVRLLQSLSAEDTYGVGHTIPFAVAQNVVVGGNVVIAENATALATITRAERGEKGALYFTIKSAQSVGGATISLSSEEIGMTWDRGKQAVIQQGAHFTATVARTTRISIP